MYFAKHETFHIRDGWLTKGLSTLSENPRIFWEEDAPEQLGLGKNMVRSLRFWLQACGLSEEVVEKNNRIQKPTHFGKMVLDFDPYLELDGSYWLIHHQLLSHREFATSWYWFFNHFIPVRFSSNEFLDRLAHWNNLQPENKKIAINSLKKDFDALVKTYLSDSNSKSPEDVLESPLTSLGLFSSFSDYDEDDKKIRIYRYESPSLKSIHPLVFLFVLLSRQEKERGDANQLELGAALREPMNVGRTFNIGIGKFEDLLVNLNDTYPQWKVDLARAGGLDTLTLPDIASEEILQTFFTEQSGTAGELGHPCFELQLNS